MTIYLQRGDSGSRGDGGKGDWIVAWQSFLAGQGIYVGNYSPNFGPVTEAATERAQAAWGIEVDGAVGEMTTARAEQRGFDAPWASRGPQIEPGDQPGYLNPSYPEPTDLDGDGRADLVYLSEEGRQAAWGPLQFTVVEGRPLLSPGWYDQNVVKVHCPQIKDLYCYGKRHSGDILFHKKAAPQLLGAMQEIEEAGLLDDIISFGGTYNFRFIRGSTNTLSNHAFGVAIDLNMEWNGLGKVPALVGQRGCLRDLVPIFERWGFFWGGWYRSRKDGMHFECVKLIPTAELEVMTSELSSFEHILPWLKNH